MAERKYSVARTRTAKPPKIKLYGETCALDHMSLGGRGDTTGASSMTCQRSTAHPFVIISTVATNARSHCLYQIVVHAHRPHVVIGIVKRHTVSTETFDTLMSALRVEGHLAYERRRSTLVYLWAPITSSPPVPTPPAYMCTNIWCRL